MARMTEEEAWVLSDFIANNEITLGPNGSGWLSQREIGISGLSKITVNYLLTKAKAKDIDCKLLFFMVHLSHDH